MSRDIGRIRLGDWVARKWWLEWRFEVEVGREAADLGSVRTQEVYAEVLSAGEIDRKTMILVLQP